MVRLQTTKGVLMPRLSIDVSSQQHQQLKVGAALHGQTIKDFVLTRALSGDGGNEMSEKAALLALQGLLNERLEEVRTGKTVRRTSDDIKAHARAIGNGDV
jgi:plasmid stability protein